MTVGTDASGVSAETTDYERACGRADESPTADGDTLRREATGVASEDGNVWARILRYVKAGTDR